MQLSTGPTAYANSAKVLGSSKFFCLFLFEGVFIVHHSSKIKSQKEVRKTVETKDPDVDK
jgi:hypothetical protein